LTFFEWSTHQRRMSSLEPLFARLIAEQPGDEAELVTALEKLRKQRVGTVARLARLTDAQWQRLDLPLGIEGVIRDSLHGLASSASPMGSSLGPSPMGPAGSPMGPAGSPVGRSPMGAPMGSPMASPMGSPGATGLGSSADALSTSGLRQRRAGAATRGAGGVMSSLRQPPGIPLSA